MPARIKVISESSTWRNLSFFDNYKKQEMTRATFVKQIQMWNYPNFHIREINWIKTPVSNPDNSVKNNLD